MADGSAGLAGKTVVVARPLEQAGALVALLRAEGADALVVPLIEVVDQATASEIAAAIEPLTAQDWVVAASPHAARRIRGALAGSPARVAAVGTTTAASLPRVDLVPAVQTARGLLDVFPSADPTADPCAGRALVTQATGGEATLVEGLAHLGWRTTRIDTHHSRPVVPSAAQHLAVAEADVVMFTSGSQARAWVEAFGTDAPAVVAAIGPQTARHAEQAGLKVDVVAADHSLLGVVRAVQRFLEP